MASDRPTQDAPAANTAAQRRRRWPRVLAVILLSPLASVNPDGLNRVAMDLGFIQSARTSAGPLAGYTVPFLANSSLAKIAAGLLGALLVVALIWIAGRSLQRKPENRERPSSTASRQSKI